MKKKNAQADKKALEGLQKQDLPLPITVRKEIQQLLIPKPGKGTGKTRSR